LRKKYLFCILAIIIPIIFCSCSKGKQKKELINYINVELPEISLLEEKSINEYNMAAGQNYESDSKLYDVLKSKVIPDYTEFIIKLKDIKIETEELKEIHQIYIDASNLQLEAFNFILKAIDNQDSAYITEANKKLDEARSKLTVYRNKLFEIAEKYNVQIKQ
jgi:hypothetical protein